MELSANSINYSNNVSFNGTVKNSFLSKECVKEYVKSINIKDNDWYNFRMYVNTIKSVKNDGTKNELIIDTLEGTDGKNWGLRYGQYFKKGVSEIGSPKEISEKRKLGRDVFRQVVDFGVDNFGKKKLKAPIEELSFVDKQIKIANVLYGKARLPQNQEVSDRLVMKADKAIERAGYDAGMIKMEILNNL